MSEEKLQKINYVKEIIEHYIYVRNNYKPSCCVINFHPIFSMWLDFVAWFYSWVIYFVLWITSSLIIFDPLSITKKPITIKGRRASTLYEKFSIELFVSKNLENQPAAAELNANANATERERERRIIYWLFLNYYAPDEDIWNLTLRRFNLDSAPKFTIRLWQKNIKTDYIIDVEDLRLPDSVLNKGNRKLSLYSYNRSYCRSFPAGADDTGLDAGIDTGLDTGHSRLPIESSDDISQQSMVKTGTKTEEQAPLTPLYQQPPDKTVTLIKSVNGKIPIGGLTLEKIIQDVGANKKTN